MGHSDLRTSHHHVDEKPSGLHRQRPEPDKPSAEAVFHSHIGRIVIRSPVRWVVLAQPRLTDFLVHRPRKVSLRFLQLASEGGNGLRCLANWPPFATAATVGMTLPSASSAKSQSIDQDSICPERKPKRCCLSGRQKSTCFIVPQQALRYRRNNIGQRCVICVDDRPIVLTDQCTAISTRAAMPLVKGRDTRVLRAKRAPTAVKGRLEL
jgi:hypothetical protein